MTYSWVSVEMLTGIVIADLPDLDVDQVSVQIGEYTSASATLPLPTAPENWERATLKGGAVLVLLDTANTTQNVSGNPVWGGFVTNRTRDSGDVVQLSLATVEAYFDRRYVGDVDFDSTDQNAVASSLIQSFVRAGSNGGLPIRVRVVGAAGAVIDQSYTDISDVTVYSALQTLAGLDAGIEWTVSWEWSTPTRITPVFTVGNRIGNAVATGMSPAATFELPGPVVTAELDEDYTASGGANDVMATSTASGASRPQSDHVVSFDPERPTFEFRYSPATSITDTDVLQQHAVAKAAELVDGTNAFALESVVENAPQLGMDWERGDDLGYVVSAPGFPDGLEGVARCVGWQLKLGDLVTITPVIQDPDQED